VVKASAVPEIKAVLDKPNKVKGLKVLTTKGKELGRILDFAFDETTGDVEGYELSSGLWSDAFDGNPFLPTPQWIEMGKDVAFVAPEVEPTIKPSTGDIKRAFKRQDKPSQPVSAVASTVAPAVAPAAVPAPAPAPSSAAAQPDFLGGDED
jgi:uncharacterized protein YrrD